MFINLLMYVHYLFILFFKIESIILLFFFEVNIVSKSEQKMQKTNHFCLFEIQDNQISFINRFASSEDI